MDATEIGEGPADEHKRSIRSGQVRRRPSGEPPPLPRGKLGASGRLLVGLLLASVVAGVILAYAAGEVGATERFESSVIRAIAKLRTPWLTSIADGLHDLTDLWFIRLLGWSTMLVLIVFRRWRHLAVFVISILLLELATFQLQALLERPRPLGVTILSGWEGPSFPARGVATISVIAIGAIYALVPHGRWRFRAKSIAGAFIVLVSLAEIYLAVNHPSDVLTGALLGFVFAVGGFRIFAPSDIFPVSYGRGTSAHLDLGGERGEAIRMAVADGLGLQVVEVKPFGLAGSGGSSPMRLRVEGGSQPYLFAKLYATQHVRADRWYKTGRTIRYGALEDEKPFKSVRQLVEYEDYALRLMRDSGIPVATPYGVVEITPEREYMIVTELFEGAVEISEAEVDDRVIDDGLLLVRKLWEAGLAHRDIKPANLLVRDCRLQVIDVAFGQVRPSPWRQAVDLANMMLVLALYSDPDRVYERALQFFQPDEIAEAFAATYGMASPSQLRTEMKRDDRDLVARFRELAPTRPRISIQRWSLRRVGLTGIVVVSGLILLAMALAMVQRGVL
ncbi:MAG: phosphatase PAP2 family protein [Actinomycetota bacterium]